VRRSDSLVATYQEPVCRLPARSTTRNRAQLANARRQRCAGNQWTTGGYRMMTTAPFNERECRKARRRKM